MVDLSEVNTLQSATSFILIVASLTFFVVYYFKKKYAYWERRGVPYAKPTLFFGNIKDTALQRVPMSLEFQRIYKELDGHKFGGFYQFTKPCLLLRDPDLITTFMVKCFPHFHDVVSSLDEKLDPLSAHLFNLTGQRWKNVRQKITPVFSSGKLKLMENSMKDCVEELDTYLTEATNHESSGVLNLREVICKFTTDVIGSCVFGLHCNAIRDENSEFRRIGRLIFKPSYRTHLRFLFRLINPRLISVFKLKARSSEIEEFFRSMLREEATKREATMQKRNDFLQLLIDVQEEEKKELHRNGQQQQDGTQVKDRSVNSSSTKSTSDIVFTDNVIASNAVLFFGVGFESVSTVLSYCMYELALNPDICEKVRDEIECVKQAHDGNLDYDTLKELVYVESVISETLRKYSGSFLARRCTEAFQMPGTSVVIEAGTTIFIPTYGLHHDPKYYPEPEKFLPDRFSEENKHSIIPGTFLAFGYGPRNCIGMRFARFQIKSLLSYLVSNFTVHPCEKTPTHIEFDCRSLILFPREDIWVRFQKRQAA